MTEFTDTKPILTQLDQALYQQYEKTNCNLDRGLNPFLKISANSSFVIATPKQEEKEAEILRSYFPERHFVPLPEILSTVACHTGFLEQFQHWQQRYAKGRAAKPFMPALSDWAALLVSRKWGEYHHRSMILHCNML